ncbi:hypothetical protein KAX97_13475 [candidate division WOR-3 bacterium]|nr:hypothetical protein [candidate division WOR-3 bacterium]
MRRKETTINRIIERVNAICLFFDSYIEEFNKANLFSGPSPYFHFRALDKLKSLKSPSAAVNDELFLEYLYATLTAWGLHRMGPRGAKLVEFDVFVRSLKNQKDKIEILEKRSLLNLSDVDLSSTIDILWDVLANIEVSASKTKLVANSKALHHFLPDLIPPIDRQYTLRFFYDHKTINGRDEQLFREIYPQFHKIGLKCKDQIRSYLGYGFHTSDTKVIDNAIVGFVLKKLKKVADIQNLEKRKLSGPIEKMVYYGDQNKTFSVHDEEILPIQKPKVFKGEKMSQADEIREFVLKNYIEPARREGKSQITIRAGDVDREMRLGRVPNVNQVLGGMIIERLCGVRLLSKEGTHQSTTMTYTYEILPKT